MKKSSLILMDEYYLKFIITGLFGEYDMVDKLYDYFKDDEKVLTKNIVLLLSDMQKKIKNFLKVLDNLMNLNIKYDNEINIRYLKKCLHLLYVISDTNKLFINYIRDKETDDYFNRDNLNNLLKILEGHKMLFNMHSLEE